VEVVILAAGAGRRFGGAKQFTPVAPDGATLLEITARNARRAGCDRAVIVTAPGREAEAQALFSTRPVEGLHITALPQRPGDLPAPPPALRKRPWGTAHALWAARDAVTGPFLVFNADDDYGPGAPVALAGALRSDSRPRSFFLLGYPLGETLSRAGTVSRAVCTTDKQGRLTALREYSDIDSGGLVTTGPDTGAALPLDARVSMNAWAFTTDVFPVLENTLREFLACSPAPDEECYLPAVINDTVKAGTVEVGVLPAPDRWCGITWPGDRKIVARKLAEQEAVREAGRQFGLDVADTAPVPFGDGLINATWFLDTVHGPYLIQRINDTVFPDPAAVAENSAAAARRVDDALHRAGDDDPRHRLVYREVSRNRTWVRDAGGSVWRTAVYVPGARSADPASPREVRAAARALGRFPGLVEHGSGPEPVEVLPGFHDTRARVEQLLDSSNRDSVRRLGICRAEYDRLVALSPLADRFAQHNMPVRPVHNDAKLGNVLLDETTGEVLCVVDLDTVMPGLAVHDFGDLVRSAVTGYPEDEPDVDRIGVRAPVFVDLVKGYLEGGSGWLTGAERKKLFDGAIVVTYEQAVRFLTDYIDGDLYFPVSDDGHNLRRARAQLRLLEEMLDRESYLRAIVDRIGDSQL
jgi:hypothetical protein